jgi:hypothetical protein
VSACTLTTLLSPFCKKSLAPSNLNNQIHYQLKVVFFLVVAVSLNSCGFLWLGSSREIEEKILTNVYVSWGEYGQCV